MSSSLIFPLSLADTAGCLVKFVFRKSSRERKKHFSSHVGTDVFFMKAK